MASFITKSRGATTGPKLESNFGADGIDPSIFIGVVATSYNPNTLNPRHDVGAALLATGANACFEAIPRLTDGVPEWESGSLPIAGAGCALIVQGGASAPGIVHLETKSGGVWTETDSAPFTGGECVLGRALSVSGESDWRVRVEFPRGAPSQGAFTLQTKSPLGA